MERIHNKLKRFLKTHSSVDTDNYADLVAGARKQLGYEALGYADEGYLRRIQAQMDAELDTARKQHLELTHQLAVQSKEILRLENEGSTLTTDVILQKYEALQRRKDLLEADIEATIKDTEDISIKLSTVVPPSAPPHQELRASIKHLNQESITSERDFMEIKRNNIIALANVKKGIVSLEADLATIEADLTKVEGKITLMTKPVTLPPIVRTPRATVSHSLPAKPKPVAKSPRIAIKPIQPPGRPPAGPHARPPPLHTKVAVHKSGPSPYRAPQTNHPTIASIKGGQTKVAKPPKQPKQQQQPKQQPKQQQQQQQQQQYDEYSKRVLVWQNNQKRSMQLSTFSIAERIPNAPTVD